MPLSVLDGGSPEPLGVTLMGTGVNVAVFSAHASAIEFCLFDAAGQRELRRVSLPEKTGDIFHGFIGDIAAGARYGLRGHGVFAPSEGHRFNPSKLLVDPYARAIDRPFKLHPSMYGSVPGSDVPDGQDSAPAMPKGIVLPAFAPLAPRSTVPWDRTVLYELHVRGFTMRNTAIPEALRGMFGGLAHPAALDHLVRLGVTTVEIMPAAAWIEERHLAALGLPNYWGYNTAAFMTPDPRLAPGGWEEVRTTVAALAEAGIETISDIVLNHTAEGSARGPTLSFRGLDNASYYRLHRDDRAAYCDDAGCGNVLALDRPHVVRLAMDALRAWAELGGVHGFRFDLAPVLGRRPEGFDPTAPLLTAISQDPVLRDLKMVAEPWDVGIGGYWVGHFPGGWGEWNDRFRDDMRGFWRGDAMGLGKIATRLAGSADLFAPKNRPSRGVNFVVAHDGFTLADLVSYEHKANEANGEQNRDGSDENRSWNNGVEGPADDPRIRSARAADQRALLTLLLLSRGTPMLAMGSELGHSQGGNNNAYAQDNETSWIDWAKADRSLRDWTARLIAIRRDHAAFRDDRFLTGRPPDGGFLPDAEWFADKGRAMEIPDWDDPHGPVLVMMLSARGDRVALAINRGHVPATLTLPEIRTGHIWQILADSSAPGRPATGIEASTVVPPRSVLVLGEAAAGPSVPIRRGLPDALDRLAKAAGVAGEWEGADYSRHIVGDDTKRALLAALQLLAGSDREAGETLARLAQERDRRPLPYALTLWVDEPVVVEMPLERGIVRRPVTLSLTLEGGETRSVRFGINDGQLSAGVAADGRAHQLWRVTLPPLPVGRHRLQREDAPDAVCWLTIAPRRAHLPPMLKGGGRAFGISAQLYAMRGHADQGIGDFTVLSDLAAEAARQGASMVVMNPLHALFAAERGRASPYQPSDRRFLDPIYLDVGQLGDEAHGGRAHDLFMTHSGAFAAQAATADVGYRAVWGLKQQVLERSFADFEAMILANPEGEEAQAFERFIAAGGNSLERFGIFEAISETLPNEPWTRWPGGLSVAHSAEVEGFAWAHRSRVRFHQYLQYLCDLQLGGAARRAKSVGLGLGLMRDLAIGAAPDGCEVWAQPDIYIRGVSVGAPPDLLAPTGQIWGLPPTDPHRLAQGGFQAFAGLLAANMRHAGGMRIDHAMGLTRLFWVPDGAEGKDGAYVAYPFKDMLGQVTLESVRAECLVVGEDLGTVPHGFREPLAEADVQSYRVLFLERDGVGFNKPQVYAQNALSCISTHDLPTFAGWWEGADLHERALLGIIRMATLGDALAIREEEKAALVAALVAEKLLDDPGDVMLDAAAVMPAAHAYVASARSTLVVAQTDDLAGERIAVNLPGTSTERPNWRRKIETPIPDLFNTPGAQAILEVLRKARPGPEVISQSNQTEGEAS
jgi:glycogen debranching enzyme GlgX/4-alpha-glucanotransferase